MSEANETLSPAHSVAPPLPDPPKDQSLVPSLSKETWELLELRLWNSFSKKLWVLLTSVLTLVAILGLLGMDAWLKSKVEDGLKQQRDEFDKIRKSYETRAEAQLLATGLLFSLQQRVLNDSSNYRTKVQELRSKLTAGQTTELQKFEGVAKILNAGYSERPGRDDFAKELAGVAAKFPELGAQDKRDTPIGQITELRLWSVHLQGLQAAVKTVSRDVFDSAKTNPTALAEYYEKGIYPDYLAVLKKGAQSSMWVGSDPVQVNSLMPDPRLELNFFIPSAFDAIFK